MQHRRWSGRGFENSDGRSWALGLGAAAMLLLAGCAGSDSEPAAVEGLYLGDDVSFTVATGRALEFRFTGVECRVPHPEIPAISLCLLRPDGLPAGEIELTGRQLSGEIAGVWLEGELTDEGATGSWTYAATCPDGASCEADGEWFAVVTPIVDDLDPPDGPAVTASDDTGTDTPLTGDGAADADPDDDGADPTGGGAGGGGSPGTAPADSDVAAFFDANGTVQDIFATIRAGVGLSMPTEVDAITAAAQAHADYFALHHEAYAQSGLNPHSENPDWTEGFTGESPGDRLAFQGYSAGGWSEIMAFSGSAAGAMAGWMETLYHRVPLVHPNTVEWGFGMSSGVACEVLDSVFGGTDDPGPALWPLPDATGVPPSWNGWESPQPPLPAGESYPSGPIITVTFRSGTALSLTTATLTGPAGQAVPSQVQGPHNDGHLGETWALYSHDPLDEQTTYTVTFEGDVAGAASVVSWSFTTW